MYQTDTGGGTERLSNNSNASDQTRGHTSYRWVGPQYFIAIKRR